MKLIASQDPVTNPIIPNNVPQTTTTGIGRKQAIPTHTEYRDSMTQINPMSQSAHKKDTSLDSSKLQNISVDSKMSISLDPKCVSCVGPFN